MREFFEKYKLSFDPLTIANIVLGIVLIINPEFSTRLICIILGFICLIGGIFSIYKYFAAKKFGYKSKFDTVQAIVGIILSFVFLFCPDFVATLFPIIIGILIIMQSISKIRLAMFQKNAGAKKWTLALTLNIIGLILGICLVFNPFSAFLSIIRMMGIVLLINGISRLFTDFFFAREMDKISRDEKDMAIDVTFDDL